VQTFRGLAILACALLAWGCAVDADPDSWAVTSARSSAIETAEQSSNQRGYNRRPPPASTRAAVGIEQSSNQLSYNRLAFNRLAFNRLAFNRLAFNRLAFNRLAFNSLDGLETTPEGRELLLYVARCALAEGDVLVATVGEETYEFPGLLGLALEWEHRGLELAEARWVSACLITHVNAYNVPVEISLRAFEHIAATPDETHAFPVYEATFFGDVFGDELMTYGCIGQDAEIAGSHAPDRPLRVCADPGPDCQVTELGYCRDVCDTYVPGTGWTECWAGGVMYEETISSFLRSEGEVCRASCSGSDLICNLLCPSSATPLDPNDDLFPGNRILTCDGFPGWCTGSCRGGDCLFDASQAGYMLATVLDGGEADISCIDTGECFGTCKGQNTRCELDCTGATDCAITRCELGARCLVDCTGTTECAIEQCQGQLQTCANGVVVCNRPCPGT
jgi:hypothetical protein